VAVPTRDPVKPAPPSKEVADNKSSDSKSKTNAEREAALQKLIEENRKRVELMKDEDLDGFWARLKKKLNK